MDLSQLLDPQQLAGMLVAFLPKLATAFAVFIVFLLILKVTRPALRSLLARADFEDALIHWLVDNVYRIILLTVGAIMAVDQLGVNVGAALAGLGVAGIAVGFAAQDTIANTIAGILIFWDKPFKVGDFITTQDLYGEVRQITMRTTRIRTPDNTYVVIPNRKIIEEEMVNHSMYGETRVRVPVGIAYKEDVSQAREAILAAVDGMEGIMSDPVPDVVVTGLGSSSVNLEVRVWIEQADRERGMFFQVMETCKTALDASGIQIPFPHLQLFVEDIRKPVWEGAAGFLSRSPDEG